LKNKVSLLSFIVFLILIASMAHSEDSSESGEAAVSLFKSKTYLKNPLELRDPFKRKISKKSGRQQQQACGQKSSAEHGSKASQTDNELIRPL
jgi:hypothetical protein